jgi:O-antigen/teichoic acid export membrane protein
MRKRPASASNRASISHAARPTLARTALAIASTYGLGLVLSRLLSLVTLPLLARAVAPETFGTFATLISTATVVYFMAIDWGMGVAAMRLATEGDARHEGSVFKTLVVFRLLSALLLTLVLCAFAGQLSRLLAGDTRLAGEIPLVAASIAIGAPSAAMSDFLRISGRHRTLSAVIASLSLVESTLLIALVLGGDLSLRTMLWARVAAQLAILLIQIALTRTIWRGAFDRGLLVALLRLGLPIGALHLLMAARELDRVLIAKLTTLDDVGLYEVASRLAAPLGLANAALGMMIEPIVYRHREEPALLTDLGPWIAVYARVFTLVALSIGLLSPEILSVLAPDYRAAAVAVPALAITAVTEGLRRVAGLGGDLAKRTGLWLFAALVQLLVTVPLTVWSVPRFGIEGAALALCCGTGSAALVAYFLARRVHSLRLPVVGPILAIVAAALVTTWAVGGFGSAGLSLGVRMALIGVLGTALALERVMGRLRS